jgi:hypothetical protein
MADVSTAFSYRWRMHGLVNVAFPLLVLSLTTLRMLSGFLYPQLVLGTVKTMLLLNVTTAFATIGT